MPGRSIVATLECHACCQVLGKAFEVITFLSNTSTVSKKDAFMAIGGLVDKMSDIKLKGPAGETLTAFSEALGPPVRLHAAAQEGLRTQEPQGKILSITHVDNCSDVGAHMD